MSEISKYSPKRKEAIVEYFYSSYQVGSKMEPFCLKNSPSLGGKLQGPLREDVPKDTEKKVLCPGLKANYVDFN